MSVGIGFQRNLRELMRSHSQIALYTTDVGVGFKNETKPNGCSENCRLVQGWEINSSVVTFS
jgi:hypothetical protein